jgi:hypothetical protein
MRTHPYERTIMNISEKIIYEGLKKHPGSAYITPDGKELYALADGGMFCWTGMDFKSMSEDEVNLYIQESLKRHVL